MGAIVISHDRELLEAMDAIVELATLGAGRYGGNWGHYRERKDIELGAIEQDLAAAERRRTDPARKTRQTAERQQRRNAAGSRKAALRASFAEHPLAGACSFKNRYVAAVRPLR